MKNFLIIVVGSLVILAIIGSTLEDDDSAGRSFTNEPTRSSEPVPDPIELTGSGTSTERIELSEGLWTADITVTGNESCFESIGCSPTNFAVTIESVSSDGGSELLVNEIEEDWGGSVLVRVEEGFMSLAPGRQIVSVDAKGSWAIRFVRE